MKVRVKAVGLDFPHIVKWLETSEATSGVKALNKVVDGSTRPENAQKDLIKQADTFVKELNKRLDEHTTDKMLRRAIDDHLQCFGPGQVGSNLLLNRYLPKQQSLLRKFKQVKQQFDPEESKE